MKLDTLRHDVPTILILATALLLLASPFFLALTGVAAISAYVLGFIGVAVAGRVLLRPENANRWLIAATGAAIASMPWIAGFAAGSAITWLHLGIGAAFLVRAFWPEPEPVAGTHHASKLEDDHAMPSH